MPAIERVRLDRWLWAARFFRTRAQAKVAIQAGKVQLRPPGSVAADAEGASMRPKVSKEIAIGELLEIRRGWATRIVEVTGLSEKRGAAAEAALLYRETAQSLEARESERARRRMAAAGLRVPQRRPDKRDRRELAKLKQGSTEEPQ